MSDYTVNAESAEGALVPCPACGQPIRPAAKKCKHCRAWITLGDAPAGASTTKESAVSEASEPATPPWPEPEPEPAPTQDRVHTAPLPEPPPRPMPRPSRSAAPKTLLLVGGAVGFLGVLAAVVLFSVRMIKARQADQRTEWELPPEERGDQASLTTPPKGFQVLAAPVSIPDVIPEIDLSKAITNEADFSGRGVAGGVAAGVVGGVAPVVQDQPYFDFQVEKPAASAPGSPGPRYPDILRSGGVEGEVLAQFVVDTTGRVEVATFRVLRSTHDLFEQAVRSSLPNMRFLPAEVGGRKVKQLVQQPFAFNLQR